MRISIFGNDCGTLGAIPYAVITLVVIALVLLTLGPVMDEFGIVENEMMEHPDIPYSHERQETFGFLQMCYVALAFVSVFTVIIFLIMNGVQDETGGI